VYLFHIFNQLEEKPKKICKNWTKKIFFPPCTLSVKVEQLLHRLRRKNKEKWEKYHIFNQLGEKIWKNWAKSIFSPLCTLSVKVEQLLHGVREKNEDTGGKNIIYFPQLDFCTLLFLARQLK
jgi:hypothetical protein